MGGGVGRGADGEREGNQAGADGGAEHGTELAEEDRAVAESAGQSDLKLGGERLGQLGAGQVGRVDS